MKFAKNLKTYLATVLLCGMLSLSACGGGSDDPAPAPTTYDNSSLSGVWIIADTTADKNHAYFKTDGNGIIVSDGFFSQGEGTYTVNTDGSFTLLANTRDSLVLEGQLSSTTTGTLPSLPSHLLKKVSDVRACQGTWSGSITDTANAQTYSFTFIVGTTGSINSISGDFVSSVSGEMYCEGSDAFALFTTPELAVQFGNNWDMFKISGTVSGDSFTGGFETDSSNPWPEGTASFTRTP